MALVLVSLGPALADETGGSTTLRILDAGNIGDDGWVASECPDGHFTISLPGLYTARTMRFAAPTKTSPISAQSLTAKSTSGLVASVNRLQYGSVSAATDRFTGIARSVEDSPDGGERVSIQGFPSVADHRSNPLTGFSEAQRFILVGKDLFWLYFSGPSKQLVENAASWAFNSLQFDPDPVVLGPVPTGKPRITLSQ